MITAAEMLSDEDIVFLGRTWRGLRIISYYKAYGGRYDFCKFFRVRYPSAYGIILIINSTIEGSFEGEFDVEELAWFIESHIPSRVQLTEYVTEKIIELKSKSNILSDYKMLKRTMFELSSQTPGEGFNEDDVEFNPSLDSVYNILQEGFPNLLDYGLWLTDTSHRCRHGISHVMSYKNATTATIMFDINNQVLIGQVATSSESRGLGYARDFLKWLGGFLNNFQKKAVLYALDMRVSFYREIGFKEIETEYVFERYNEKNDDMQKGELA